MTDQEPGEATTEGRPDSRPRRKVAKAAVAVPATVFIPFVMVYRSLRDVWNDQASRGILVAAGLLLVAGTILFAIIEGFSALDSFYFSFITLATIGYGDLSPVTDLGKIVTVIYSIAGLGIMAALISSIATSRHRAEDRRRGE